MRVLVRGRGELVLAPEDFVGQGGEGAVYAKGDTALKIYADPGRMMPAGKMTELARIADPRVLTPESLVCEPATGRAIGYTMPYVRDARTLAALLPRAARERVGLDHGRMMDLVLQLRARVAAVHRAQARVVDLSEMNFVVDRGLATLFAIDTDSYETPSYPATAITPSVADPLAGPGRFSEGSDWFSFAVLAFQMLLGIHPYRGAHPDAPTLEERMRRGLSVLGPGVRLPPAAVPLATLPSAWRAWLVAVLERGERTPPPESAGAPPMALGAAAPLGRGTRIAMREIAALDAPVREAWGIGRRLYARTEGALFADGRRVARVAADAVLAFSPRLGRPVAVRLLPSGCLEVHDLTAGVRLACPLSAQALAAGPAGAVVRSVDRLVGLALLEIGESVVVAPRVVGRCPPHATQLFEGVAVLSLLGGTHLALLPAPGRCHVVRLPELDGHRVVDARLDGSVVMARAERGGRQTRVVIRFDEALARYEVHETECDAATPLDFVVLDSGVCVARARAALEIFAARPGRDQKRTVADPSLAATLRLGRDGVRLLGLAGTRIVHLSMRADRLAAHPC
jgi:hypothetical protein